MLLPSWPALFRRVRLFIDAIADREIAAVVAQVGKVYEQSGAEFDPAAQPLLMSLAAWRSYYRRCLPLKPLATSRAAVVV